MEISQDEFHVFCSGTIVLISEKSVVFKLNDTMNAKIIFSDVQGKEQRLSSNIEGNTLIITAENFSNSLGTCTSFPINVGSINNKELYFHFAIYAIGNEKKNKVMHYTWFVKEGSHE